ncbi:MAG: proteasome-activating nucleotidase, partial [Halobacteriota archaeon]
MSHSPSIPDRPQLNLDPDMSSQERLEAMVDHYRELVRINRQLSTELNRAVERRVNLRDEVDRLQRENDALKTSALYVATIEEVWEDDREGLLRQHGNNQEILTGLSAEQAGALQPGDRVAVNDSFTVQHSLDTETDARAQAMAIDRSPDVTYADIGGMADQIREVREAVEAPLREPERFEAVGVEPPSGVLLHGEPGTGKTLLAKAVANQTDATFIKMAGSELVRKFIGEGSRLVRDLFQLAREEAPSIIFIDEIDAIAAKRTESKTSGDAEVQRTMMQLLSEMDGFDARGEVSIIGATNRFDMLDRAILRPGRFDRIIEVPRPDREGREEILRIHTRHMALEDDVDLGVLAVDLEGYTGADIESLVTEAGMAAIR